jgi:hypothetical protein
MIYVETADDAAIGKRSSSIMQQLAMMFGLMFTICCLPFGGRAICLLVLDHPSHPGQNIDFRNSNAYAER